MQQQPQNRPDGSLRRGNQCSGPRLVTAKKAPHREPRLRNQTAAALIRRPVSHARGGVFLLFCAESNGTSAFAALPVAACSDQLGAGTFFARHVTIAGRSAGGIVSGFESCGARLSFARRVAGHQSAGVGVVATDDAQGLGRLAAAATRGGRGSHSHTRASRASDLVANRTEKRTLRSENGDGLTRAHSHTGAPRSVPPTLLSSLAACAFAANGAGRAFFFAVGARAS